VSKFTRPAPWLRQFFTPSQTEFKEPSTLSNDVSIIQPYDGGGFPLFSKGEWNVNVTTAAGAAQSVTLLTVGEDNIARILAIGCGRGAGATFEARAQVTTQAGNPIGCTNIVTIPVSGEQRGLEVYTPVLGPGHVLVGRHEQGDSLSVSDWNLYYVEVPLGAVFYV